MKSRSHRLPTISDTPDDWVEESWTVDCVCGVNFDDGEEMVNCDECGVWVHTRCSRYVKSEKSFACDKCKNKNLRNESEETEVAQLLVELPTKTMRMENPCSMSCPPQNAFQVWTEIPVEEKVHVQGIPGGDPALFGGFSSVFSPQLWKCTGYVPKKFNFQYREFSCWEDGGNKSKEEIEIPASTGADALFSLSKDNELPTKVATLASQVEGGRALLQEKRQHGDLKKERSLPKPIVIHSGNRKKDDSRVIKDLNRRKAKIVDRELDSNRGLRSFESAHNTSSDAKQPESYEGKSPKVVKTDKQSCKDGSSRADVHAIRKAKCFKMINADNNPFCRGQASEKVCSDDSRHNRINKDKTMVENDGNQVPPGVEISTQSEDVMASSLIHNAIKIPSMENEVLNDHEKGSNRSDDVEKVAPATNDHQSFQDSNGEMVASPLQQPPVGVKAVEIDHPGETSNSRNLPTSDTKLDSAKSLAQDTAISPDPLSASVEVKDDAISVSQDHKGHLRGSARKSSSVGKPSSSSTVGLSKSSVPDQMRHSNTENAKQKGSKKDNTSSEVPERPKKLVKDLPKSLSTSALKSSHLSKFSHAATISRKNSSDLRDPASKTSPVQTTVGTQDSADSATSLHAEKKTTSETSLRGEKNNQLNRQPAPKNLPPSVHPPATTNSPATLSDEELALLLHQELNSSPRVPRVPRMRHAGSLPQLASPTPTSTLMKRTFTYGGKDNGLVSRKKNKDLPRDGSSNYDGAKADRVPPVPSSRTENGSSKVTTTHSIDKSTTVSSGPSSSNEHNMSSAQNTSDDETGAIGGPTQTHRTLPVLIAEIMSKGKRMTYEELCNAVLPHWPNLRKLNGERYAYSSHSQAVLDCLRNRSEWSRLVDRGPKTNASRKRRKNEADPESEEKDDDSGTKDVDGKSYQRDEFPKGKRKARKRRRLALQGRGIKDVRRRRKAEVFSDDIASSSDSSDESMSSDDHGVVGNEASGSSDETGAMS